MSNIENKIRILACTRMKEIRTRAKLTQAKFARRLSLSLDAIAKIEHLQATPSLETVYKTCKIFGITMGEFFSGVGKSFAPHKGDYEALFTFINGLNGKQMARLLKSTELMFEAQDAVKQKRNK